MGFFNKSANGIGNVAYSTDKPVSTIGYDVHRSFVSLDAVANGYVSVPALTFTGDFEIELQLSSTATGADRAIFDQAVLTTDGNVLVYIDNPNGLDILVGNGAGFDRYSFGGQASLFNGKLNTLSINRVSNTLAAELNGAALGGTHTVSKTLNVPGNLGGGVSRYFDGVIANVKIWTGGNKTTGTLVREYRLDESSGATTATDIVGGQDGTYTNVAGGDVEKFNFEKALNQWSSATTTMSLP